MTQVMTGAEPKAPRTLFPLKEGAEEEIERWVEETWREVEKRMDRERGLLQEYACTNNT